MKPSRPFWCVFVGSGLAMVLGYFALMQTNPDKSHEDQWYGVLFFMLLTLTGMATFLVAAIYALVRGVWERRKRDSDSKA